MNGYITLLYYISYSSVLYFSTTFGRIVVPTNMCDGSSNIPKGTPCKQKFVINGLYHRAETIYLTISANYWQLPVKYY